MSFDIVNVGAKTADFKTSEQFDGFSKVVVEVSDDLSYTIGNDSGRTLTVFCPWANEKIAADILNRIKGYQYQPYHSNKALLNPAAEIGDGVNVGSVYSGIFSEDIEFNSLCPTDISAPFEEEIEHEYEFKPRQERKVKREIHGLTSELKIQADKISAEVSERKNDVENIKSTLSIQSDSIKAKVSKTGGSQSTFGWELLSSEWRLYSGTRNVLKATKDGLEISGKVTALSGTIGGFNINEDYLSYNSTSWGGSNSRGIYIGTEGIQLGSYDGGFRVDNYGNLYAENGHFRGTIDAGNIDYGGSAGYFSGAGLSSHSVSGYEVDYGTLSTDNTDYNINTSLGNGDYSASCLNGYQNAPYLQCLNFKVWSDFYYGYNHIRLLQKTIGGQKITYLGV